MLQLSFTGWFQCRLATDPDPHDETRGVSGYVKAYAGEPDLDRLLFWQSPPFERTHGPQIGVFVDEVFIDGNPIKNHPLIGAPVDLLDRPMFEGRNGVIAEDGFEPIFPFVFKVEIGQINIRRAVTPLDESFPFEGLFASGVEGGPQVSSEILQATGYSNGLPDVWKNRLELLTAEYVSADDSAKLKLVERIQFLSSTLANPPGTLRFFGARMRYEYALNSTAQIEDPDEVCGPIDLELPWKATFWLGGWDADVLCGYASGTLDIPYIKDLEPKFGYRARRP